MEKVREKNLSKLKLEFLFLFSLSRAKFWSFFWIVNSSIFLCCFLWCLTFVCLSLIAIQWNTVINSTVKIASFQFFPSFFFFFPLPLFGCFISNDITSDKKWRNCLKTLKKTWKKNFPILFRMVFFFKNENEWSFLLFFCVLFSERVGGCVCVWMLF